MRLILCKDMMRIAIIHGMEIIVGHIALVEAECHRGRGILQSCRNTLSVFIRIIPGTSCFQKFLLDIIRHLFCRHNMEDISDRKGRFMLEACSAAAIHISAHIAGYGLPCPGSIRGTGVYYAHQFAIWFGCKIIGNQTFIYATGILHTIQLASERIRICLQLSRSLISIVIIPSEISSRFQICTFVRIAGKWQRQFLGTATRDSDIIIIHMRLLAKTVC